jgi:hypothetical protein
MPVRPLPENPSLQHLRYQAKDLLKGHATRDAAIAQRLREFHPKWAGASDGEIFAARLTLAAAQLAIAREYGFVSWARLKRRIEKPMPADQVSRPHHERIVDPVFRRAVDLIDAGDVVGLGAHLKRHPAVTRMHVVFEGGNYFRNPALLEFVAENPVRHGKLPKNIVEIAKVIIDAGVDGASLSEALGLVVTGCVPRECGVQIRLIDLLCDEGADPDRASEAAAAHGELEALRRLLMRGARLSLTIAAAMGRTDDAHHLLSHATRDERHLALALSAQFGRAEIVRLLLDAGEDANRFNPVGAHSHSTPLHQAALGGHLEVVKLLVERGAKLDMKDILFGGTPADWAEHGGKKEVERYLRGLGRYAVKRN